MKKNHIKITTEKFYIFTFKIPWMGLIAELNVGRTFKEWMVKNVSSQTQ